MRMAGDILGAHSGHQCRLALNEMFPLAVTKQRDSIKAVAVRIVAPKNKPGLAIIERDVRLDLVNNSLRVGDMEGPNWLVIAHSYLTFVMEVWVEVLTLKNSSGNSLPCSTIRFLANPDSVLEFTVSIIMPP